MGSRGASSSYKNWDTLFKERDSIKQQEMSRRSELIKQGIPIPIASDRARREFEKEYDIVDEKFRKRSLQQNKKRR